MNPNNTPESDNGGNTGHGKRSSKVPYVIAGIAAALIAIGVAYSLQKSEKRANSAEEERAAAPRNTAKAAAESFAKQADAGLIAAYVPPKQEGVIGEEAAPAAEPKTAEKPAPEPLPMQPMPMMPLAAPPAPDPAVQEIKNMRKRAFLQAMAAPTKKAFSPDAARGPAAASLANSSEHKSLIPDGAYQNGGLIPPGKHLSQNNPAPGRDSGAYGEFGGDSSRWSLNERMKTPEMFTVQTGFVLPATLISGVNSDLAGQLIAQVSHNVYDTPTGKYLLIPQGTKLVGQYSANVQYGQERVLVAWQRLVFPDGRTLDLGSMPGADVSGYSGFEDQVNNHLWRLYRDAFLLSGIVGLVAYNQNKINERNSNNSSAANASSAFSEALGQELGSTSTKLIEKNMSISPTIEIRPGYRFNVVVTKDLVFDRPYTSFGR